MDRQIKMEKDMPNGDYCCNKSMMIDGSDQLIEDHGNHKINESKVCRVCGDKALSINFNVITCESCKAFFRRNALKPKDFRCPFNGSCEITIASRKFCKKCRLRKCFEVGMMKEWIMSEEARLQKRQLIEGNREKRRRTFDGGKYRKVAKIEILDSPPPTSSSSDEHQSDTPTLTTNINDYTRNVESNFSHSDRSISTGSSVSNADSIVIPKSVLLNLISRCQQNSHNACSQCPPPPILTRAMKLYESGSLNFDDWYGNGSSEGIINGLASLKCICSCACGALAPSIGVGNGVQKNEDNGVLNHKPGGDIDQSRNIDQSANSRASSGTTATSPSAFRRIDYNRSSADIQEKDGEMGQHMEPIVQTSVNDPNNFNARIEELLYAKRAFDGLASQLGFGHGQLGQRGLNDPADFVRITQAFIARIVEMAKRITAFRNLTSEDQLALLLGGMRHLLMLHSTMNYDHELDSWLPFGRNEPHVVNLQVINELNPDFFEQHAGFIRSFAPQWSTDDALMQMMVAICLFDPRRPKVVDTESVFRHQQFYTTLMKRYLMTVYGQQEGLRVLGELANRLDWLHQSIDRMQPTYHIELSPTDLSPMLLQLLF